MEARPGPAEQMRRFRQYCLACHVSTGGRSNRNKSTAHSCQLSEGSSNATRAPVSASTAAITGGACAMDARSPPDALYSWSNPVFRLRRVSPVSRTSLAQDRNNWDRSGAWQDSAGGHLVAGGEHFHGSLYFGKRTHQAWRTTGANGTASEGSFPGEESMEPFEKAENPDALISGLAPRRMPIGTVY